MPLIYILEDDKNIQEIEYYAIKGNGYDVRAFDDAGAFYRGRTDCPYSGGSARIMTRRNCPSYL